MKGKLGYGVVVGMYLFVLAKICQRGRLKFQDSECMLAAFLHDQVQTSYVLVQHVGPQVMTCWTNKLCQL